MKMDPIRKRKCILAGNWFSHSLVTLTKTFLRLMTTTREMKVKEREESGRKEIQVGGNRKGIQTLMHHDEQLNTEPSI